MVRVLLPFRGVAVLLLAASTVVGQTPEPPAELPLDSPSPGSADFLRQFSAERNHPLLSLMVDGEMTSFDASSAQESSPRLKPAPQGQSVSSAPATETVDGCPAEIECPTMPMCLPFACPTPPPPPCHCRKCQRKQRHSHCGNYGAGCGNPYLGWPCAMGGCGGQAYPSQQCCGRRGHHGRGCGYNGYGYSGYGNSYGYGGGWNTMTGDGFLDGCCGGACTPFLAPAPPTPPQCQCRRCQRKHGCGNQGCGYGGYGSGYGGGYGGGWGMGFGGFMDDGFCGGCCAPCMAPPPPQPQCHCRRCQRKHGCSSGSGYAGYGYPGWPNYPVPGANMVDGGYNGFANPNCFGCGKQRHGLFHHRCGHQAPPSYPYCAYPQMMPCMQMEPLCADCGFGGDFVPSGSGSKTN